MAVLIWIKLFELSRILSRVLPIGITRARTTLPENRTTLIYVNSSGGDGAYRLFMLSESIQHSYGSENDHLDLLLHELIRAVDSWPSECQSVFDEFRVALEEHIRQEERFLFPIYEKYAALKSHSPTGKMRSEHRQLHVLLDEIQEKLDFEDWQIEQELTVLKKLLSQHSSSEELIVYSKIDEVLTMHERDAIVRRRSRDLGE